MSEGGSSGCGCALEGRTPSSAGTGLLLLAFGTVLGLRRSRGFSRRKRER